MCEGITEYEDEIPNVEFKNHHRDIFGVYDRTTNTIYINPIWNGVDTVQISYTFLHEFVHYLQWQEDPADMTLRSALRSDVHDWDFLRKLFKVIQKHGTEQHYGLWVEEVLFYRFHIPRATIEKTFHKILGLKYKSKMEKYYES
jgi:hypothetical protein